MENSLESSWQPEEGNKVMEVEHSLKSSATNRVFRDHDASLFIFSERWRTEQREGSLHIWKIFVEHAHRHI